MELLLISLLGGLLALDGTSVGQFMVSRPLVAGALAGWTLGEPATGVLIGAVLELYLLVSFPSGGARFPEGASATVVAVASAAAVEAPEAAALGVAMGLIWGQVGGLTISLLRRMNGQFVPEPATASYQTVSIAHRLALAFDLIRGVVLTFGGVVIGRGLVQALAGSWPLPMDDTSGLLLVGGAVSAGILLRSLGGFRRRSVLFAAGLALGFIGTRLF
jgi:mannose/fructose/N-acetylgalactosamine-specific phosphotransferase system component IIC